MMLVVSCGSRTELGSGGATTCTDCDAATDGITHDAPHDALADVSADAPIDVTPDVLPPLNLCGNGVLDQGEECDLGADNSDLPIPFAVTQSSTGTFDVNPFASFQDAVSFYDYIGASSFTGLEVARESRLYLYLDSSTNALSLIVNHNIHGTGNGSASMTFVGLPTGFSIALSDDAGEFLASTATSATGMWNWSSNTDGGVIGGLACPDAWTITVSANFTKGIDVWNWVNDDKSRTVLAKGEKVKIQSFDRCMTDCTIPPCGQ